MYENNYTSPTVSQPSPDSDDCDTTSEYPAPIAYFPADSAVPASSDIGSARAAGRKQDIVRGVRAVTDDARQLAEPLAQEVLSMSEVDRARASLSASVTHLQETLQGELDVLSQQTGEQASAEALGNALAREAGPNDDLTALAYQYILYDHYFYVYRIPGMSTLQFTAQVTASCRRVLDDLALTTLGIDEVVAIVRAIGEMFAVLTTRLCSSSSDQPLPADSSVGGAVMPHHLASPPITTITTPGVWQMSPGSSERRTRGIAFERWRAGHHFFDLCAMFSHAELVGASQALAIKDEVTAAAALLSAALFLRGTTAAMWYASDFPRPIYEQVIRPSMVSTTPMPKCAKPKRPPTRRCVTSGCAGCAAR